MIHAVRPKGRNVAEHLQHGAQPLKYQSSWLGIPDIMPNISAALRVAWPLCYSNHDPDDIAEIRKGDLARRGITEEDDRYYADWAGIQEYETTNFGYKNLCSRETKLASKWSTSEQG